MPSHNHEPIDKQSLENFLKRVPELSEILEKHTLLVAHFGYFLSEEAGESDITPGKIRACYEAAAIQPPANITDVMRKSHAFIRTRNGTQLHRDFKLRIKASLATRHIEVNVEASIPSSAGNYTEKARRVVVIHGRDSVVRDGMFEFLRSLGLAPIEWSEAVARTGRGTPYTGEVVEELFRDAQAIVVILSPDEHVELRGDLNDEDSVDNSGWQPRPNVFIEAGMALAKDEKHTIVVEIGKVRQASDLFGRNVIRFDGSPAPRHELAERLRTAGCDVSTSGTDWLRAGNFRVPPASPKEANRRKK